MIRYPVSDRGDAGPGDAIRTRVLEYPGNAVAGLRAELAGTPRAVHPAMTAMITAEQTAEFLASIPAALDLYGAGSATPADAMDAIRRDLKLAVAAGVIPAHAKFSCRRKDYKSLYVDLVAWHGQVLSDEFLAHQMAEHTKAAGAPAVEFEAFGYRMYGVPTVDRRLTAEINRVMALVEVLTERHNFNKSDIQSDYFHVGYYTNISSEDVLTAAMIGVRMECDRGFAEMVRAAQAAANRLGPKVAKAIIGGTSVEGVGEYHMNTLIQMDRRVNGEDPAAPGKPLEYSKSRRRWVVARA